MSDLSKLTLQQIRTGLRNGDFSSRELTQAYLDRIERLEPQLKTFITLTPEIALGQAELADQQFVKWREQPGDELPALLGVPTAVKDVLCVADTRCTAGSRILENFVPAYSATAVERLKQQGVVILGKTNTDEFAMGSSTENSAYHTTHNPWDTNRVPGGSSGGSAAAVAAQFAPIALGTDTGGSVRQPASYCGVTGLKPTYGAVSRYGLIAFGSSLDVVGVIGKNVQDVALTYWGIAGHDPLDSTTSNRPIIPIKLNASPKGTFSSIRIGVPAEYFKPGMLTAVEAAVRDAIKLMANFGAQVIPVSLPHTECALPVYYLIAPAEASANLARYDGIRYGARVQGDTMWDIFYHTRGTKFGAEVKRRIMLGTYALSAGYYDAYYGQAQKVRTLIKKDFERVFEDVDIIATPTAPTTAFRVGEHVDDPLSMYLQDIFTLPANLAGIPGISFPAGSDQSGLPIGIQLMASPFREDILFQATHAFQQVTDFHLNTPKL